MYNAAPPQSCFVCVLQAICSAVQQVLAMPLGQRQLLGQQARLDYVRDRQQFVLSMQQLKSWLLQRLGRLDEAGVL